MFIYDFIAENLSIKFFRTPCTCFVSLRRQVNRHCFVRDSIQNLQLQPQQCTYRDSNYTLPPQPGH